MKARIHPGRPAQIAVAAFVFLVGTQSVFSQVSNQFVAGKVNATAGSEAVSNAYTSSTTALDNSTYLGDGGDANYAIARHYAEIDGAGYGVSSFAAGVATSYASVYKAFTFTAQSTGNYSLSTFLDQGSLDSTAAGGVTGFGSSQFDWYVEVNGSIVISQHLETSFDTSTGGTFSPSSNLALFGYSESSNSNGVLAQWRPTTFENVWQGFLSAGETVDFAFGATSSSTANYSGVGSSTEIGFGCYGNLFTVNSEVACGSSTSSFGDPAQYSSQGGAIRNLAYLNASEVLDITLVSSVPEPGEWAMMLAGLGTVGLIARRRRKLAGTQ
jgi:hypothetical protein